MCSCLRLSPTTSSTPSISDKKDKNKKDGTNLAATADRPWSPSPCVVLIIIMAMAYLCILWGPFGRGKLTTVTFCIKFYETFTTAVLVSVPHNPLPSPLYQ